MFKDWKACHQNQRSEKLDSPSRNSGVAMKSSEACIILVFYSLVIIFIRMSKMSIFVHVSLHPYRFFFHIVRQQDYHPMNLLRKLRCSRVAPFDVW